MIPFNPDFKDLLSCLLAADVHFLLVGGYALAFHGHPRATKDMDVWVEPTRENAERILRALASFGAPTQDVTADDFTDLRTVFQIGVPPRRVGLVCSIEGVAFDQAWGDRESLHLDDIEVPVIGLEAMLANKQATGRAQDIADAEVIRDLLKKSTKA
ncbi:MAG TPA: nucleotidyl transferase AbiEii/AbiGii toxin family protein [Thermoanaerobaculaceae bacterium]|nr:nucleotidyl transferase AbiEii/AbiGii toxin family protein [Thermoanaerobaculaceae bacterium]